MVSILFSPHLWSLATKTGQVVAAKPATSQETLRPPARSGTVWGIFLGKSRGFIEIYPLVMTKNKNNNRVFLGKDGNTLIMGIYREL